MLLERYTSPPNLCTSQDDSIFRKHFFLNCMCLHTKRSLKHALPLWLLLILQGVPADAGKYTLSQVSFPPSRVVIICPGCQETGQILLGQEHLLTIPVLLTNGFGDTGQQSAWAQHTSEPRAWEKCQVPVPITSWLCTRAPSSLLEMQTHGPYRSGDLLLPDLPVTDLVVGFMSIPGCPSCHPKPPSLHKFPFRELYVTNSYSVIRPEEHVIISDAEKDTKRSAWLSERKYFPFFLCLSTLAIGQNISDYFSQSSCVAERNHLRGILFWERKIGDVVQHKPAQLHG